MPYIPFDGPGGLHELPPIASGLDLGNIWNSNTVTNVSGWNNREPWPSCREGLEPLIACSTPELVPLENQVRQPQLTHESLRHRSHAALQIQIPGSALHVRFPGGVGVHRGLPES